MTMIEKGRQFFQETLWQEPDSESHPIARLMTNTIRMIYIVIKELAKGELNLRAMSLVFTTLLSLVPLLAVAFSVLKAFGVHNQIEPMLLGVLEPLGSKGVEITDNIISFVQNMKVGVLGTLGVAMLFYTIISLVQKIENAFNFVWHVKTARTLARRFTDYLSVVMIGPVMVVAALGMTASVLNHNVVQTLQAIEPFGTLILAVTKLTPYLMIIIVFSFLYKFIPNTRVKLLPAVMGALVAGILWVSVGTLFASFVASSSNYTAIYSSFAILFFFMIWLYLAWLILLTGSQVAFYLQHPNLVSTGDRQSVLSARQTERIGLMLMVQIAQRFYDQKPALSIDQLETEIPITSTLLEELLAKLTQQGLLVEVAHQRPCYQPGRDLSQLKVSEILTCLRTAEEPSTRGASVPVTDQLEDLIQQIDQARHQVLGDKTLHSLVVTSEHGR